MSTVTYELYEGKEQLHYIAKGRSHGYEHRGNPIPGVTTVTGIISNANALMYWAVNCSMDYLNEKLPVGKKLDEVEKRQLLEKAKWAHRNVSGKALAIGSEVHDWIERHINLQIKGQVRGNRGHMPFNPQVKMGVEAYLDWEAENKVLYRASERKILSREYGYAGTLDIEAEINGELGIQDVKTSKAIYDEMKMQVAAYGNAREEETGEKYTANHIIRVPKEGGSIEVVRIEDYETALEGFLGCLVAYRALQKMKKGGRA